MNTLAWRLLWLFAGLGLLACAGPAKAPVAIEGAPVAWEGRSARAVLAELKAQQARIEHLSAAFSLTVDPPPRGRPSGMSGAILFSRERGDLRLRVTALGPFGRTYFDMVQEAGEVTVYIPARETAYRGEPSRAFSSENEGRMPFSTLFADLSGARARAGGRVTRENGDLVLPLENGRLLLDPRSGLLRAWQRNGIVTTYGEYVRPGNGPPVPTRLRMRKRDGSLRVDGRLSEVSLEPPPGGAFSLPLGDSTTLKPLETLEP